MPFHPPMGVWTCPTRGQMIKFHYFLTPVSNCVLKTLTSNYTGAYENFSFVRMGMEEHKRAGTILILFAFVDRYAISGLLLIWCSQDLNGLLLMGVLQLILV